MEEKKITELQGDLNIFKIRTRTGTSAKDKSKVYLTTHSSDTSHLDDFCDKILAAADCAIYYIADETAEIAERDKETTLGRMNLFVVPVTYNLLKRESGDARTMRDVNYAKGRNIPILPVMMEPGLDSLYEDESKFGKRHYLKYDEFCTDERLSKHLEPILISKEQIEKIRKAFAASIFLSYRKMDKNLANELIKKIHKSEELRDVAVWFDDYLTPGEDFEENIKKAMDDSKLFALLVTQNLLSLPNYVKTNEYPAALKNKSNKKIPIISVEMEAVDDLDSTYGEIDEKTDIESVSATLADLLKSSRVVGIEDPDERAYLLGLAYLKGVDSEIDTALATDLITRAANNGHLEAMQTLYWMYSEGAGVELDYNDALSWCKKIQEHFKKLDDKNNLADWTNYLTVSYLNNGEYNKAITSGEEAYELSCEVFGDKDPHTLASLCNLATAYGDNGTYDKAKDIAEEAYNFHCEVLGKDHPDTIAALHNLATAYADNREYGKAIELGEEAYYLCCKFMDTENQITLASLSNLSAFSQVNRKYDEAIELGEKAYNLRCKILGENHPDTLASLNNVVSASRGKGEYEKAIKLGRKAYNLRCKVLGAEHPDTLTSLNNLACTYHDNGEYDAAIEIEEKTYNSLCKGLGKEHPDTMRALKNLLISCYEAKSYRKFVLYGEKWCELNIDQIRRKDSFAVETLKKLIASLENLEKRTSDRKSKKEIQEKLAKWRAEMMKIIVGAPMIDFNLFGKA